MVLVQRKRPGDLVNGERGGRDVVGVRGELPELLAQGVAGGLVGVDVLVVRLGAGEARFGVGVGAESPREVVRAVPELRVVAAGFRQAVEAVELRAHPVHAVPVALRELLDGRVAAHEEGRPGGLGEAGAPGEERGERS